MKTNYFMILLISLGIISLSSCNKEKLFIQPSIEVTGYTLEELPKDSTHLTIDVVIKNNDKRSAHIKDANYQVVIDGYTAQEEYCIIDKDILSYDSLILSLPITLLTSDAIQLLKKLDNGEELSYSVTGTFHVDDPILKLFDLPINIQGSTFVDVGFDDFFNQPDVLINNIDGDYTINGFTSYTFNLNVNSTITNLDAHSAVIDEIEYTATIEGVKSTKRYYTESYTTNLVIAGNETLDLTLPVTLNLGITTGATLASGLLDGTADYIIEGTFHVLETDGTQSDFTLPLYVTGTCPASVISLK